MCRICEGASHEEVLAENATRIAVCGYMLQGVVDDDHQTWVYTTGLLDAADHPELIVAGVAVESSVNVLNALAEAVLDGQRYTAGGTMHAAGKAVRFGAVDEIQYELGTFNMWYELRNASVLSARRLTALQVLFEPSCFCSNHQSAQPILSDPRARVGEPRLPPNRAARRRR